MTRGVVSGANVVNVVIQCLSSITEFPDLVATIQSMRGINPLQVRLLDDGYLINELML